MVQYDDPKSYDKRFRTPLDKYSHSLWQPFITKKIEELSENKIVLDLGCGTCEYLKHTKNEKMRIGVDVSWNMLKYGAKKLEEKENTVLAQGSAYNIPLKSNSVDFIICIGLLEFVDLEKIFEECKRVLKKGKLLIVVPNKWNMFNLVIRYKNIIRNRKHFKEERSTLELKKVAKKFNFKILEKDSFGMITYYPIWFQKVGLYMWKILEDVWKPFQDKLPLGCNLYLLVEKSEETMENAIWKNMKG